MLEKKAEQQWDLTREVKTVQQLTLTGLVALKLTRISYYVYPDPMRFYIQLFPEEEGYFIFLKELDTRNLPELMFSWSVVQKCQYSNSSTILLAQMLNLHLPLEVSMDKEEEGVVFEVCSPWFTGKGMVDCGQASAWFGLLAKA